MALKETKKTSLSAEENDQIDRSKKKAKTNITSYIFNQENDTTIEEAAPEQRNGNTPRDDAIPTSSFKDMLQGSTSQAHPLQSTSVNPLFDTTTDDGEVSDDDLPPEDLDEDSKCPVILLTKEEKMRLRRPWKSSLIVKMFDKHMGYMTLMRRLTKKWQLKGAFSFIDIGCSYYIARFNNMDDYNHVLLDGPWLIDDHYLTIRTWIPNFVPDNEPIKFLTAWVHIPNLAVEYFDSSFLERVGSKIGKVIKVDKTTASAERGQFTRLCIEIDLSKPLLSKFWLKGKIWKIQYEGLRLICYNCGKINHKEEECPKLHNHEDIGKEINPNDLKNGVRENPEQLEDFGSWMLVKKPTRTRPQPKQKRINANSNIEAKKGNTGEEAKIEGSRFQILVEYAELNGENQGQQQLDHPNDMDIQSQKPLDQTNIEENASMIQVPRNSQQSETFETVQLGVASQPSKPILMENSILSSENNSLIKSPNKATNNVVQQTALKEINQNIQLNSSTSPIRSKPSPSLPQPRILIKSTQKQSIKNPSSVQTSKTSTQANIPSNTKANTQASLISSKASQNASPQQSLDQDTPTRMVHMCRETNGNSLHGDNAPPHTQNGGTVSHLDRTLSGANRSTANNVNAS
ncbi:hypothetical protein RDABS01_032803 [Bienertia sinuspersici]